jgi:hypothetical protein
MQNTPKDMICGQDCLFSVARGEPVPGITSEPSRLGPPFVQVRASLGGDLYPAVQPVFWRKPLMTASSLRVERPSAPRFVDGI